MGVLICAALALLVTVILWPTLGFPWRFGPGGFPWSFGPGFRLFLVFAFTAFTSQWLTVTGVLLILRATGVRLARSA
jgi:hypothetical protein